MANKHIIELMNFCALVGVIVSIFYAHTQLQEARQSAAVNSLLALKSDITESRRRVYNSLVTVWSNRQESDQDDKLQALRMDLMDHLLTIESSCTLYLNDVLGEEARRFLEAVIAQDLEFLGDPDPPFSFYVNGDLVLDKDNSVPWVDPEGEPNPLYPNTIECAKRLNVSIGGGDTNLGF